VYNVFADKEECQKELMKMHETFLKAIAYYKKKLHIRLRFDDNGLILVHFLDISTPECKMCSLKLEHADGIWSCEYVSERISQPKCMQ